MQEINAKHKALQLCCLLVKENKPMTIDNNLLATNLLCVGRFHHFHLVRQLEKHGLLKEIWTDFPHFALKYEEGIPSKNSYCKPFDLLCLGLPKV